MNGHSSAARKNGHNGATSTAEMRWWKDAVTYQIYPSTFKDSNGTGTGDLQGVVDKLDYLKDLGVTCIWISPFFKIGYLLLRRLWAPHLSSSDDHSPQFDLGYDISDYTQVHEPYGKVSDIDTIIKEGGARGIKVLADLVINHTSHQHKWFEESRSSKDNPKRDWYIWRPAKIVNGERKPPCNWKGAFGGSTWTWDEKTQEYYYHTFLSEQPEVNWENPVTRQAIYDDAVRFWLDRGIAGFRVDTVNMYSKNLKFPDAPIKDPHTEFQPGWDNICNGPRLHEFLKELRKDALGDCVTIGELPHTPNYKDVLTFISTDAKELDMVIQFDVADIDHHGWGLMADTWTLPQLKAHTKEAQRLADPRYNAWATTFLGNHDQARPVSRFGSDEPEYRVASAKMLATYLLTLSGTPIIYQGEEIGMINIPKEWDIQTEYKDCGTINFYRDVLEAAEKENDPSLITQAEAGIRLVARDHSRTPMQWDDSLHGGFSTAKTTWMRANTSYKTINAKVQENDPDSVLNYYRKMIKLRKAHGEIFTHGAFEILEMDNEQTFIFKKTALSGEKALVILNFTKDVQEYNLPKEFEGAKVALDSGKAGESGKVTPFAAKVYIA